jgi:multiple antibiotic resistance protein
MWWQQRFSEFVTLFLVVNPFGVLPTFLEMSAGLDARAQRKLAAAAALIAFVVLAFFVFAGAWLLSRMGISIRAFQISGGILMFLVALDMIRGQSHAAVPGGEQAQVAQAVFPLAIPKIASPGAMLAMVVVTDDDRLNLMGQLSTVGVLAVLMVVQFVTLLAARPITWLIGIAGVSVVSRVMGMLLAALAVTMVVSAVGDWLNLPQL